MNIAIYGAGSTGCYLAAELLLAGLDVSLICRERIKHNIIDNKGIHISDYQGMTQSAMPTKMLTDVEHTTQFDVVFVTLKCHQLDSNYTNLLKITHANSSIIFMQNGLGSFDNAHQLLPQRQIYQGITPFNVLQLPNAHFHKGTAGQFIWPRCYHTLQIRHAMKQHGLSCQLHDDMAAVINGKLLLNLNNALNAMCDLPIQAQLKQRPLRRVLAQAMQEWLKVCQQANRPIAQFTKVPPKWVPVILSLPDGLFSMLAKSMLDIDPKARSSMWEDLQAKRITEIDYLNGAVVKLGQQYHVATPINQRICAAIKRLEQGETVDISQLTANGLTP